MQAHCQYLRVVARTAPAQLCYVAAAMKRKKRRSPPRRRKARRAARRATPKAPRVAARPPAPPAVSAETELLALARTLAASSTTAERAPGDAVIAALAALGTAFQAGAALPRALAQARMEALADKTRALALAWAREQLRLVLGDVLDRAAAAPAPRVGLTTDALAWVLLAACEALADEPLQAAPDRIRALEEWLTGPRGVD